MPRFFTWADEEPKKDPLLELLLQGGRDKHDKRWVIYVTRADGSTVHACVPYHMVDRVLRRLVQMPAASVSQISISREDPNATYVDQSPKLPLQEAADWRPPNDEATRLLQRLNAYYN